MEVKNNKLLLNNINTLFITNRKDIKAIGKILSNDNRLKLLQLSDGRLIRKEIEDKININSAALTKNIKIIDSLPEKRKLLKKVKEGNTVSYIRKYDYILIGL